MYNEIHYESRTYTIFLFYSFSIFTRNLFFRETNKLKYVKSVICFMSIMNTYHMIYKYTIYDNTKMVSLYILKGAQTRTYSGENSGQWANDNELIGPR